MNTTGMIPMKLKTPKYTWQGAALALAYLAAGLALMAVTGCATYLPKIPESQRAPLKGRAFVLQSVTVSPDVTPKAGADENEHCLPDSMYAAMLKDQLEIAFRHAGLDKGEQPAVPVRVVITRRIFPTVPLSIGAEVMSANLYVNSARANRIFLQNPGGGVFSNLGSGWTRHRIMIPSLALMLTNGLKEIQIGGDFNAQPHEGLGVNVEDYWQRNMMNLWMNDKVRDFTSSPWEGLDEPMSVALTEHETGKSATELAAICKANEEAAK